MKNKKNYIWNGHDCNLISIRDYEKYGIHKILALIFYVDDIDGFDSDGKKTIKKNGIARYVDVKELKQTNENAQYQGESLYELFKNNGGVEYWIEDANYNFVNYD